MLRGDVLLHISEVLLAEAQHEPFWDPEVTQGPGREEDVRG